MSVWMASRPSATTTGKDLSKRKLNPYQLNAE